MKHLLKKNYTNNKNYTMIVKQMTNEEIHKEIKSDFHNVWNYALTKEKAYQRAVKKSNKFPISFKPIEYNSPKRNKYYVILNAYTKKDWKNIPKTLVCVYDNGRGINAIMISEDAKIISIYSQHLFFRYRSRFLKDEKMTTTEVIQHFFAHNSIAYGEVMDDFLRIGMTCDDGVLFGNVSYDGKIFVQKTFVGFDMLFDSQDEYKEEYYDLMQKCREDFIKRVA